MLVLFNYCFNSKMKFNTTHSIIGSGIAFIVATSCCWLPALIIGLGGATSLMAWSSGLERYSGIFMVAGAAFLGIGIYQYYSKSNMKNEEVILTSTITCPKCGHQKEETMPINACQYFYECESCKVIIKPSGEDCCVYCSYGTVACPPIQLNQNCC